MKHARGVAFGAGLVFAVAACAPPGPGTDPGAGESGPKQDPKAQIEVWVDDVRTPGAQDFARAHPELKIKIKTVPKDPGWLLTNLALKNKAGEGWPDAVFLNTPEEVASLADVSFQNFAEPLNGLIDQSVLDGFADGALAGCTFGGKVYCARNDIGQTVLWYNKKRMDKFGYEVPKTWADYKAIGEKVAKDHAGYVIGSINGKWGAGTFFESSGCPTRVAENLTKVKINTADPACTRVADVLEPLLDNGAVSKIRFNDNAFQKLGKDSKVLMMPGPSWYGEAVFKGAYETPKREIAAAPMPLWDGQPEPVSGSVGGAAFVVSSHSKNKKAAAEFVTWMTTDVKHQASQPTYPAFEAAAAEWGKKISASDFYADDPIPAMREMAPRISKTFGWVRYATEWNESFNATVAAIDRKGPLAGALAKWGEQLKLAAQEAEYEVGR